MTDTVFRKLEDHNTKLQNVPANMTNLYQPLDAQGSVNGGKEVLKQKSTRWCYSRGNEGVG